MKYTREDRRAKQVRLLEQRLIKAVRQAGELTVRVEELEVKQAAVEAAAGK